MNINFIRELINPQDIINGTEKEISSFHFDSRQVERDSCFIAIKGTQFDGHQFIDAAINQGAIAIICEQLPEDSNPNIEYIVVKNSRKALSVLAQYQYNNPAKNLKIIGITGTNGKTTITFLLDSIFKHCGYKTAIIGTTGNYINGKVLPSTHTTPDPLTLAKLMQEMHSQDVEYLFIEVSSHALHQDRVYSIEFYGAIFTNLTHDHLDYHKTMEEYAAAKGILFNSLNEKGIAIVNGDDPYSDLVTEYCKSNVVKIGRSKNNDYIISREKLLPTHSKFQLNGYNYQTNLLGKFNVDNIATTIVFSKLAGIDESLLNNAVSHAQGATGRMQSVVLNNNAIAIIDYAHTPDALEKALITCRNIILEQNEGGRLISIFGCGGDRDKTKRPKMGEISKRIADISIITSDNPRTEPPMDIINDITVGIENLENVKVIMDRKEAIAYGCDISKKGDIIVIAGKGHENYQIIGHEKLFFSDFEELNKFC